MKLLDRDSLSPCFYLKKRAQGKNKTKERKIKGSLGTVCAVKRKR